MPTLIIKTNASQVTDVLVKDMGILIPNSGGSETFTDIENLDDARLSLNLRTLCTDNAYDVGSSTLILNDGTQDIAQEQVDSFLADVSGIKGETGTVGYTGAIGYTGPEGLTGLYGATGLPGPTGYQGHTGYQGFTGSQGLTGYGGRHTLLTDMPDVTGMNTDHDIRLVPKVQGTTPTLPTPFTGMIWWDTASPSPFQTISVNEVSSGPYNIASTDECVIVTAGTFAVNLPAATGSGRLLWIKNLGTGLITVTGSGAETIDGSNTQPLLEYDCLMVADYASGKWSVL